MYQRVREQFNETNEQNHHHHHHPKTRGKERRKIRDESSGQNEWMEQLNQRNQESESERWSKPYRSM